MHSATRQQLMSPWILFTVSAACVGCLVATAPASSTADAGVGGMYPLSLEPHVHETRDGEHRVSGELGRLLVPENRARADSRSIELVFVRLPSLEGSGPPVVYLAGGPGGSGIDAGRGPRFRLFDALRERGDVILLDQRGAGRSSPIEPEECPVVRSYPLDRPVQLEPYLDLVAEVGRACGRFWRESGVDLAAYDTLESVEDLEDLRRALGVDRIDLLAISYGTHLALAYMRSHPERVRRAVLAGVEGPDDTVKLPGQFEAQLAELEELAHRQDAGGPRAARQSIHHVLEKLDHRPTTVRIVEVEGPDRETRLVVGPREVAAVTMDLLRDPETMIQIPHLYRRLESGDFTDLAGTLLGMRTVGGFEALPEAMDGASGISPARLAQLEAEDDSTLLGSGLLQANVTLARSLGVPDLGPDFRAPVQSDVPTLFVSGSLDGRTPTSNALRAMEGFSSARHIEIENGGHGDDLLIGTPALETAIVEFLAGREPEISRVELPPPDLSTARRRAPLTAERAARYVGEYERRPREIWRILHHTTVESLDDDGEVLFANATLQIRWDGNGFPFHPVSETRFYIDFPWFLDVDFRFELDESGNVTHLVFEDSAGETVRMEKVH